LAGVKYPGPIGSRYNWCVAPKISTGWFLLLILLASSLGNAASVRAAPSPAGAAAPFAEVTAYDLIVAMNTLRTSYGLPALVEDPIIDAVAQATAETMAANQMSWHIGNVAGRLAAAGYGGGAKVWATENFAVGNHSIDEIMVVWSDASHMIPAVNPAYCNVGAGVAKSGNGMTYYVLQAAYTAAKSCGEYKSSGGKKNKPGGSTNEGGETGVSQLIMPVKIATPDADGRVFHVVEAGQSFWAIAVAYKITIKDLETWNNLSRDSKLQIGQRLFIPGSNTEGYATPTPVGMVQTSTPDPNGKIVHTVQAYQTLSTIAAAYKVSIDTILALNGIQPDWFLQIGQKLVIQPSSATPTPTPPPLSPIQRLTPESDGKYYHIVRSGESLSWIAALYGVKLNDLMAWNGLNASSVLHPDEKLILQVTPPATDTPTPAPVTATPSATAAPPTATPTLTPTVVASSPTATVDPSSNSGSTPVIWFVSIGLAAGGLFLLVVLSRRRV
jgi:LysM repeat protein